jgi:YVTN family beta-propeller protein
VNPVTDKIYVANSASHTVTVIDGPTNGTTIVGTGTSPVAVAVNQVTNMIYVANYGGASATVIDGATNAVVIVPAGEDPYGVVVNPVTNKAYVTNYHDGSVTVIDGATNTTTTVAAGASPWGLAANPVTGKIYVANEGAGNVTVITEAADNDTKVHATFDQLPGDTTTFARPSLTGKGMNRWTPGRTAMMGVGNRANTSQTEWDWAGVTFGQGTDSITWLYNWGADSLIMGENFVCAQPLEDQAATTNNLGLGSPFAGNLAVYPLYRMVAHSGVADGRRESRVPPLELTVAPDPCLGTAAIAYTLAAPGNVSLKLYDVAGKQVRILAVGNQLPGVHRLSLAANQGQRRLAAGVYVLKLEAEGSRATRKLVIE